MPIAGIIASSNQQARASSFYQISQLSPSAVSTVTFSSIPATYKSLQVRYNLVASNPTSGFGFTFNGDSSSANYVSHYLYGTGATVGSGGVASGTWGYNVVNHGGLVTTYPNVGILDIIDYANTNKNKVTKTLSGGNNDTAGGTIDMDSGIWLNTAAITSITMAPNAGTFTGTISLYGAN